MTCTRQIVGTALSRAVKTRKVMIALLTSVVIATGYWIKARN
jgi:hypothetical protein